MNAKRIEYRNTGRGWASVIVKDATGKMIETYRTRNNADSLVKVSDRAKANGANGVSWGACSSNYWVGFTF